MNRDPLPLVSYCVFVECSHISFSVDQSTPCICVFVTCICMFLECSHISFSIDQIPKRAQSLWREGRLWSRADRDNGENLKLSETWEWIREIQPNLNREKTFPEMIKQNVERDVECWWKRKESWWWPWRLGLFTQQAKWPLLVFTFTDTADNAFCQITAPTKTLPVLKYVKCKRGK